MVTYKTKEKFIVNIRYGLQFSEYMEHRLVSIIRNVNNGLLRYKNILKVFKMAYFLAYNLFSPKLYIKL